MYKTVAESYEGQSVFITGGTGFLGKVLIEKLLYSCPGIEDVYILVREKNNITPQQRLQKILNEPLFSRLRNERPQAFNKLKPIVGDINEPGLALKPEDEERLINKVSIVFHVAATLKFDEPLHIAVNTNVTGTERVLELSKRMKDIKSFVYVSTAYSNTNRELIDEVIYPAPADLDEVKNLLKNGLTEAETKELIKDRPNTYTFTKALAEHVVAKNHGDIPCTIIRPSIVTCSKQEPMVGWIDNWMGASAVMIGVAKGWNHFIHGDSTNLIDLIPVDYVSNLIIVAGAKSKRSKDVPVYNSSSSALNPITYGYFLQSVVDASYKYKLYDLPLPFIRFSRFKWLLLLLSMVVQMIPACIMDMFLLLTGKNTKYIKIQTKVSIVRDTFDYFTCRSWLIHSSKTKTLSDSLSPSDRNTFYFDPTDINWKDYMFAYTQGIYKYLCKKK